MADHFTGTSAVNPGSNTWRHSAASVKISLQTSLSLNIAHDSCAPHLTSRREIWSSQTVCNVVKHHWPLKGLSTWSFDMRVFSPVHVLMLFFRGRGFFFCFFLLESEALMRNGTAVMLQCSREDAAPFSGNYRWLTSRLLCLGISAAPVKWALSLIGEEVTLGRH